MIPGLTSRQAAYDAAEPGNTDACTPCDDNECAECDGACCDGCLSGDYEEDPDDARDRAYAYGED